MPETIEQSSDTANAKRASRRPGAGDLLQVGRGMLMGAADVVPGVSGGTVALILGIYDRLVGAISRVDGTLLEHVKRRDWKAAATHVDLRFLVPLLLGVGLGIALFAKGIHYLLFHHTQETFAAFFGLIAGSSVLVGRMVNRWTLMEVVGLVAGLAFAVWLVEQPLLRDPPNTLLYLFMCGVIAICAMILPGISGSFILLLLGKYPEVIGLVKETLHLNITADSLLKLSVFAAGCLIGLLSFSRFLKWLLGRHEPQTLAVLCGFMLGSLSKLWPFQRIVPGTEGQKSFVTERLDWSSIPHDGRFFAIWGILIGAILLVLVLDWVTRGRFQHPHLDETASDR
jgi:putative membrane protein